MLGLYKKPFFEETGNLIDMAVDGKFDVIVHGCNCFNSMSAGIAAEIAIKIPSAAAVDNETVRGDSSKLGNFTITKFLNSHNTNVFVVNAYTQYHPGRNFDIKYLKEVISKIENIFHNTRIGFPLIGCGIGGGHWPHVRSILKDLANHQTSIEVTAVHFKQ